MPELTPAQLDALPDVVPAQIDPPAEGRELGPDELDALPDLLDDDALDALPDVAESPPPAPPQAVITAEPGLIETGAPGVVPVFNPFRWSFPTPADAGIAPVEPDERVPGSGFIRGMGPGTGRAAVEAERLAMEDFRREHNVPLNQPLLTPPGLQAGRKIRSAVQIARERAAETGEDPTEILSELDEIPFVDVTKPMTRRERIRRDEMLRQQGFPVAPETFLQKVTPDPVEAFVGGAVDVGLVKPAAMVARMFGHLHDDLTRGDGGARRILEAELKVMGLDVPDPERSIFFQVAKQHEERLERAGAPGLVSEFVGELLNPVYMAAFGLTLPVVRQIFPVLARFPFAEKGMGALRNALSKQIGEEGSERVLALFAKIAEESAAGGAGIGAIEGFEGFAKTGTIKGLLHGVMDGVKMGLPVGFLLGRFAAGFRTVRADALAAIGRETAKSRLGFTGPGLPRQTQLDARFERVVDDLKATGLSGAALDEAVLQAAKAYETLTLAINPELGELAARAVVPDPFIGPPQEVGAVRSNPTPTRPELDVQVRVSGETLRHPPDFKGVDPKTGIRVRQVTFVNSETGRVEPMGIFVVEDSAGKQIASIKGTTSGETLQNVFIESPGGPGTVGREALVAAGRVLERDFGITRLTGERISGARFGGRRVELGEGVPIATSLPGHRRVSPLQSDKAAWQMTHAEAQSNFKFLGRVRAKRDGSPTEGVIQLPDGRVVRTIATNREAAIREAHRGVVAEAKQAGKPVPLEVQQRFPELSWEKPGPTVRGAREPDAVTETRRNRQQRRGIVLLPPRLFGPGAAAREVERILTPTAARGKLRTEVFSAKLGRDARIGANIRNVIFTLRDTREAMLQAYKGKPTPADLRQLTEVLTGQASYGTIPVQMRPVIGRMRAHIDALSDQLIASGAVQGKLAAIIDAHKGVYLTRSYRVFSDPKFARRLAARIEKLDDLATAPAGMDPTVWNRIVSLVRSEYPGATTDDLKGVLTELLLRPARLGSPVGVQQSILTRPTGTELGILRRRNGALPEEVRAYWGEFTDIRQAYPNAVARLSSLVHTHRMLSEIRADGLGKFLHEPSLVTGRSPKPNLVLIDDGPGSPLFPLSGLYAREAVVDAMRTAFNPKALEAHWRIYMMANGFVKFGKTILSPMTHIRNVIGNMGFAMANGHWQVWHGKRSFRAALEDIGVLEVKGQGPVKTRLGRLARKIGVPEEVVTKAQGLTGISVAERNALRRELRLARLHGVTHESSRAGEILATFNDMIDMPVSDFVASRARRIAQSPLKAATALYRAEDDVWKLFAWFNERARYRKAFPNWTDAQVRAYTAKIVRATYPTYSLVPEAIKKLRRFPLVGNFVSFPAEVIRTAGNTLRLIAAELRDPATFHIGLQRLLGTTMAASVPALIARTSRFMFGVTPEEDEAFRRFLPPWSVNSNIVYAGINEKGHARYIDMSYTDPYEYVKTPLRAITRGETVNDKLVEGVVEFMAPFGNTEILAKAIIEAYTNEKATGGRVFEPEDEPHSQAADITLHIWQEALEPGFITQARRIKKGLKNEQPLWGRTYDAKVEAAAVFTGHRVSTLDPRLAMQHVTRNQMKQLRNAEDLLDAVLRRPERLTRDEIEAAYAKMERARRAAVREFWLSLRDVQKIPGGLNLLESLDNMKAGGAPQWVQDAALTGIYEPFNPTARYMAEQEDRAVAQNPDRSVEISVEFDRRRLLLSLIAARERMRVLGEDPEP